MMESQEMGMVEAQMNSNEKSVNRGVQTEQLHKEKQIMREKSYNQTGGDRQTSVVSLTSGVCCILTLNLYGNESE